MIHLRFTWGSQNSRKWNFRNVICRLIDHLQSFSEDTNAEISELQCALLDILQPQQLIDLMSFMFNTDNINYIMYDNIINRLRGVMSNLQEERFHFSPIQTVEQCINVLESCKLWINCSLLFEGAITNLKIPVFVQIVFSIKQLTVFMIISHLCLLRLGLLGFARFGKVNLIKHDAEENKSNSKPLFH